MRNKHYYFHSIFSNPSGSSVFWPRSETWKWPNYCLPIVKNTNGPRFLISPPAHFRPHLLQGAILKVGFRPATLSKCWHARLERFSQPSMDENWWILHKNRGDQFQFSVILSFQTFHRALIFMYSVLVCCFLLAGTNKLCKSGNQKIEITPFLLQEC